MVKCMEWSLIGVGVGMYGFRSDVLNVNAKQTQTHIRQQFRYIAYYDVNELDYYFLLLFPFVFNDVQEYKTLACSTVCRI